MLKLQIQSIFVLLMSVVSVVMMVLGEYVYLFRLLVIYPVYNIFASVRLQLRVFHVYECFSCTCVFSQGQKRALDHLISELLMGVNCHVGSGEGTCCVVKSKCS